MSGSEDWLHHDHRSYEEALAGCRAAAEAEDWQSVAAMLDELFAHLRLHMLMEEEILYPAYEEQPGADADATGEMRDQHQEITRLARDVERVARTSDSGHFLASLEPLEKAMHEHHRLEEESFLPMASHALLARREEIWRRLREFVEKHSPAPSRG